VSEAASGGAITLSVHEVLRRFAPAYLERFGATMPPRQREVLAKILQCRTPALGGSVYSCPDCGHHHFSYHSCNDRHCPQCGTQDADQWLADHQTLLLPVPYFLVTFTVPEPMRDWIRSHPQLGCDRLFGASATALQDLAGNPRRLGATLGMLGVLHTWARTLIYHPHVHYLVPGGGLSPDGRSWVASRPDFLFRVEPLSDRCRTLFRQQLEKEAPEALSEILPKVWKQRWVVHCKAVGSGSHALRYLSRYVFKTATANRRLTLLPNGRLLWPYRHSDTGQQRVLVLDPLEFIRRFLQHVLPSGFHRVRQFGWLHPGGRKNLNRVRALLQQPPLLGPAEQRTWLEKAPEPIPNDSADSSVANPAAVCPRCGSALRLALRWRAGAGVPHLHGVIHSRGPP
jgi:hypothetical protein